MEPDTTTEMSTPMSNVDSDESVNQVLTSVPLGLDSGYKGFAWGSSSGSIISTIFKAKKAFCSFSTSCRRC